ncbi:hypothetical protein K3495_g12260 [Podosphaera aphanis]|nr:hypothetical protein K3495_g12260 [Podosphaera aphanis]
MIAEHPDKTGSECLDVTIDELRRTQQGLSQEYQHEHILKEQVINACQGVKECSLALFNSFDTFEGVCHQLKSSITTWERRENHALFSTEEEHDRTQFWTDRKYSGRGQNHRAHEVSKEVFCMPEYGCWSTQHSAEEKKRHTKGILIRFEGMKDDPFQLEENALQPDNEVDALLAEMTLEEEGEHQKCELFMTELGEVRGAQILAVLDDQAVHHTLTKEDKFQQILPQEPIEAFTFDGRYSADQFQGIMPDTGAAGVSTAGLPQFEALQKICGVKLDTPTAEGYKIRFGKGSAESLGTTWVNTPVGIIDFHVVPTNTSFLFCTQDMDKM